MLLCQNLIKHSFSTITVHPALRSVLHNRGIHTLRIFQQEVLDAFSEGSNVFVNSCTGSGKTLAYLLPIINSMYQREGKDGGQSKRKGALVLTLNKELVSQVYRQALWMDFQKRLTIQRTGSISQIASTNQQTGPVKHLSWDKLDLLISTPQAYSNYLHFIKGKPKTQLLPQFLVVDQADILLQIDQNISKHTHSILSHLREHTNSPHLRCILAASTFPKRYRRQIATDSLQRMFKPLKFIEGVNRHKLPEELDLFYIQLQETEEDKSQMEKLYYLSKILQDRSQERIMLFCQKKTTIDMLLTEINQRMGIPATCLHAELKTDERQNNLGLFSKGEARVLICSELGGRGLDFHLPVDCVVQYDMAKNIVHFINRAGRTARNNLKGSVITLVEPQYKDYYEHLKSLQSQNDQLDELFSRKRSYSKLYKQPKNKQQEDIQQFQ